MANRITIDPITRIEGHLRIDVEVDNNAVSNAWASCTMWRGIEKILAAAIRATPGCSRSASAACAPPCMPWPACVRWKMR
jgi:hypothetical protein